MSNSLFHDFLFIRSCQIEEAFFFFFHIFFSQKKAASIVLHSFQQVFGWFLICREHSSPDEPKSVAPRAVISSPTMLGTGQNISSSSELHSLELAQEWY